VKVLRVPADGRGEVDVRELLRELGPAGISSVLVEGGGRILTSFLRAGAAQRVVCFVAPLLLGKGIEAVQELHVQRVDMGIRLNRWRVRRLGDDLMVDAWMNSEGASPAGGAAQQAP
jgi:riboflavin biosynthesis pyrimidine reductase